MARPLRIEYPGALYHLTSRGNAQEDIFSDDADRVEFLHVPSPWEKLQGQVLLGEQAFMRKVAPRLKSKALAKEIPKAQRHAVRPTLTQAFARVKPAQRTTRDRLIATLHLKHGYTQAQIAAHLGLHYATVSRIVSRQSDARNKT